MRHTKGPWDYIEDTDGNVLIKTKGNGSFREIAVIPCSSKINDVDWSNAALVAAAPEMLEALEIGLKRIYSLNGPNDEAAIIMNEVIKKAKNEK